MVIILRKLVAAVCDGMVIKRWTMIARLAACIQIVCLALLVEVTYAPRLAMQSG